MTPAVTLRVHLPRFSNHWADRWTSELEFRLSCLACVAIEPDAAVADLILLAAAHFFPEDWRVVRMRTDALVDRYRSKVVAYDERDRPWCWAPGAYVSMPARAFRAPVQFAVPYLNQDDARFTALRARIPDVLASFVGQRSHPLRSRLLSVRDSSLVLEDTSGIFLSWDVDSPNHATGRSHYDDVLARSKFVICPRGHGTGSYRLFEALAAGRVPVVLSDDYVFPDGPDWSRIAIRLPESAVASIAEVVRHREPEFESMSKEAALAFDSYFAFQPRAQTMLERMSRLVDSGVASSITHRGIRDSWYVRVRAAQVASKTRADLIRRIGR